MVQFAFHIKLELDINEELCCSFSSFLFSYSKDIPALIIVFCSKYALIPPLRKKLDF